MIWGRSMTAAVALADHNASDNAANYSQDRRLGGVGVLTNHALFALLAFPRGILSFLPLSLPSRKHRLRLLSLVSKELDFVYRPSAVA